MRKVIGIVVFSVLPLLQAVAEDKKDDDAWACAPDPSGKGWVCGQGDQAPATEPVPQKNSALDRERSEPPVETKALGERTPVHSEGLGVPDDPASPGTNGSLAGIDTGRGNIVHTGEDEKQEDEDTESNPGEDEEYYDSRSIAPLVERRLGTRKSEDETAEPPPQDGQESGGDLDGGGGGGQAATEAGKQNLPPPSIFERDRFQAAKSKPPRSPPGPETTAAAAPSPSNASPPSSPEPEPITAASAAPGAFAALNPDHYTIQLIGAENPASVDALLEMPQARQLPDALYRLNTQRDSRPWHVLVMGDYDGLAAAQQALAALPAALQDQGAWIRRIGPLQALAR